MESTNEHTHSVAEYYDRNHRRFLFLGRRRETGAMHRAVWAPGVDTRAGALEYINRRIAEEIAERFSEERPLNLLDVGCGVGGTCIRLAKECGMNTTGITLSEKQVQTAKQHAHAAGVDSHCDFLRGDFLSHNFSAQFDVVIAIESFVHLESSGKFFNKVAGLLEKDGLLFLCDDFHVDSARGNARAEKWVQRLKEGWRLGQLKSKSEVINDSESTKLSLQHEEDLTPHLQLDSVVTHLVGGLAYVVPLRTPFWDSRRGNVALRHSIRNGWLQYLFLVFTKVT